MSPPSNDVPSRVEMDLQNHAKTISVLTAEIAEINQTLAVMEAENKYRDEKLSSILGLGRTVLVAVIALFIGAVFAYLAAGGFRVPPAA